MNAPATPLPPPSARCRAVLVWAVVTTAVGGLGLAAGSAAARALDQLRLGEPGTFTDLLVGGCAVAALVAAGRLWVVTTEVVLGLLAHRADHGRRPRAGAVRGLLLAACGLAAFGGTTTAAGAASPAAVVAALPGGNGRADGDGGDPVADRVLVGLPLPDRATGRALLRQEGVPATEARQAPRPTIYRVRPGDCLWAIAEHRLGPGATTAEITAHWQRIHALNAAVIGPDPDLVRPGQPLRLPPLT